MNKKLFLTTIVATLTLATMTIPAMAAEEGSANTTVTYENRQTTGGDSGVWGVVIPTAVSFTDEVGGNQKSLDLELVGMNGFVLSDLSANLKVAVTAKSTNGYKLKSGANEAAYSVTFAGGITGESDLIDTPSGTIAQKVGTLSVANPIRTGSASLAAKPTVKGSYVDTITFGVSHTGDELKN